MSDQNIATSAANRQVSLSEAILASLDSVFKAQVHASRSFLNFLFQMAYPHLPVKQDGSTDIENASEDKKRPYTVDIPYINDQGKEDVIRIPTLAMIPIAPLGVDEASIRFSLSIEDVGNHTQMQSSEGGNMTDDSFKDKRPWFLVGDPKSLRGTFQPIENTESSKKSNVIDIAITVKRVPIPDALQKTISALSQSINTSTNK